MVRTISALALLAGVFSTYAAAAEPLPGVAHPARFEHAKAFAVTALDERLRILQRERDCVAGSATPGDMRHCHAEADVARAALKARLHPQFERLRAGHGPN